MPDTTLGGWEEEEKAKECPLCGALVEGGAEGMNRHFEVDCPWRHTSKSPMGGDVPRPAPPGAVREPPAPALR